jgi:capsular polysaccharide biosynthesis protein
VFFYRKILYNVCRGEFFMEQVETQQELSLLELYHIIKRYFFLILLSGFFFALLGFLYSQFILDETYISNADIMVQVENDSISTDPNFDYATAFRLIDTVAELITKDIILEDAITILASDGISIDLKSLISDIEVRSSQTSYFINVAFTHVQPDVAEKVVDALIESTISATDEVDQFPVLYNKIRRTSFASDASIAGPNVILYTMIGGFLGGIFSVSYALLKTFFVTTFRSKDDIEQTLHLQVIGVIPTFNFKGNKK